MIDERHIAPYPDAKVGEQVYWWPLRHSGLIEAVVVEEEGSATLVIDTGRGPLVGVLRSEVFRPHEAPPPNRWAAFSDEDLRVLRDGLAAGIGEALLTETEFEALDSEIQAELKRRRS